MNHDRPVVALFDFDGTITTRDSLLPFLWYLYGFFGVLRIGLTALPKIIRFVFYRSSRQDAKEALLTAAFKGIDPLELAPKAKDFAHKTLHKIVKPEALERIAWHQKQGHRCIVVSASVSSYLQYWAGEYAFDDLLCSILDVDQKGLYTGKLVGKNCWGPEKVHRVKNLLGDLKNYTIYAYGDSRGDKEMLEIADYPFYRRWS